jgi:hypothetical protein
VSNTTYRPFSDGKMSGDNDDSPFFSFRSTGSWKVCPPSTLNVNCVVKFPVKLAVHITDRLVFPDAAIDGMP